MTTLWAVSDLHAAVKANAEMIARIQPASPSDWLIVGGDVAERTPDILATLEQLKQRFEEVIWVPGNHELFCRSTDSAVGREKYAELVAGCRALDIYTPEDPYPVFAGRTIAPLFTLYDYTFRQPGLSAEEAVQRARDNQVILTDEFAIAPFVDIRAWCWDRLAYSVKRLSRVTGPTILINHWPLVIEPLTHVAWPDISLWCGSIHTRTWPVRYRAEKVIYGHLHLPGEMVVDGVPHIETSLGYPREWKDRPATAPWPYPVLEVAADAV